MRQLLYGTDGCKNREFFPLRASATEPRLVGKAIWPVVYLGNPIWFHHRGLCGGTFVDLCPEQCIRGFSDNGNRATDVMQVGLNVPERITDTIYFKR